MTRALARQRGFTLIELMVVVAVVAVLAVLAAPSLREMILMQRLRGINAQLVTDLQYARTEAVSRGKHVRFNFGSDGTQTCYVIYTGSSSTRCDCTRGVGNACTLASYKELRTVTSKRDSSVAFALPAGQDAAFAFDYVTGGLMSIPTDVASTPLAQVQIDARIDDDRRLRNAVNQTGRPSVCAPNASRMGVTAC